MPDYALSIDGDNVRFMNRKTMKPLPPPGKRCFTRSILKPITTLGSSRRVTTFTTLRSNGDFTGLKAANRN